MQKKLRQLQKKGDLGIVYEALTNTSIDHQKAKIQASLELNKLLAVTDCISLQEDTLKIRVTYNQRPITVTICPPEMRLLAISQSHTHHHPGVFRTYQRLRLLWCWPGMSTDTRRAIASCEVCQVAKTSHPAQSKQRKHLYAGRPWQVVSLDLVGPFPEMPRCNTMILVLADHFTR